MLWAKPRPGLMSISASAPPPGAAISQSFRPVVTWFGGACHRARAAEGAQAEFRENLLRASVPLLRSHKTSVPGACVPLEQGGCSTTNLVPFNGRLRNSTALVGTPGRLRAWQYCQAGRPLVQGFGQLSALCAVETSDS